MVLTQQSFMCQGYLGLQITHVAMEVIFPGSRHTDEQFIYKLRVRFTFFHFLFFFEGYVISILALLSET